MTSCTRHAQQCEARHNGRQCDMNLRHKGNHVAWLSSEKAGTISWPQERKKKKLP